MELKKNPSKDIHRRYPLHLVAGLCISCALVIGLFELQFRQKVVDRYDPGDEDDAMRLFDAIIVEDRPVQEVRKQQAPVPVVRTVLTATITETAEPLEESEPVSQMDPFEPTETTVSAPTVAVRSDEPLLMAEEMPEPIDGFQKFYKQIGRDLRYPRKAAASEIEGKVFIEFVIDREGNVSHIKVIKGIGYGCDEEAMKVLAKTKWKAGKQHGVPVKVRMVMPIKFALTN
jgi:protein TonB